ncbi:MAG TPA: glycosyltransferase [Lacunisphaera sp.]|jgi:glycosyltransferase involved in cell wall biosynthesis
MRINAGSGDNVHGEIESPRPLRAKEGKLLILGWCLNEDSSTPPRVRVTIDASVLHATTAQVRNDVARRFPQHPAATQSGFTVEGNLASGVYVAHFEAELPDGRWICFKRLSLVVEPAPFIGVIDEPVTEGVLRDRVRVGGWALQPGEKLTALTLRYGHRELPCEIGRPRSDVPQLFPNEAQATLSGFETIDFLVAGHGPARLRGYLANGRTVVASTKLTFSVATDENHGPELDLTATRASLGDRAKAPSVPPPAPTARPLNLLFILHGSFASNSALHVAALANQLAAVGHDCVVAVPHDLETIAHHESPAFRGVTFAGAEKGVSFTDGRGPDVIHAWTTRENVRRLTQLLAQRHRAKVVVHLEDNECEILALSLGRSSEELGQLSDSELDRIVPADLSHPRRSREFLAMADGVTVIIEKLLAFAPTDRPGLVLTPAADARYFFPHPTPIEFRRVLDGAATDTTVIFYHGNVHASNAAEVRELYSAVLQLNRAGEHVTLIRTGLNRIDFLAGIEREVAPFILELDQVLHHRHLPALMALADIFVQPGQADAFNDYRFPSKLPEFFAIGRPVILPRANLGLAVRHGIDAYVLDAANASNIAAAVREIRRDAALAKRLSEGASAFAAAHFSWPRMAEALAKFYAALTT